VGESTRLRACLSKNILCGNSKAITFEPLFNYTEFDIAPVAELPPSLPWENIMVMVKNQFCFLLPFSMRRNATQLAVKLILNVFWHYEFHAASFLGRSQYGDLHLAHRFGHSLRRGIHSHPHREQVRTVTVICFCIPLSVSPLGNTKSSVFFKQHSGTLPTRTRPIAEVGLTQTSPQGRGAHASG